MVAWRIVVFGLVFSIVGYAHVQGANDVPTYQQPLYEFYQLVEKSEDMKLNEWRIRLRDERVHAKVSTKKDFINFASSFEKNGWGKMSLTTEGTEWKAHFTYVRPSGITESLQFFVYPTPSQNGSTHLVTYEVFGTNGSVIESNIVDELVEERIHELDMEDSTTYVQIQANDRSTSKDIEKRAQAWIHQLGAETVEALKEESFVSYSAYNPDWTPYIETNGTRMNIQVAIREKQGMGTGTTLTIGTPIITTEY
ncbi:YwmB family TATA-box binding protein [Alkalihalobacillus deserti]|uniref:YwmB family TATA-box binding protein n=1 Tax=Alkalihalobacillus deserti TaxID=2879466 RepID=UPI001D137FB1|nr:YwmB family TATA-box binding protein [Alkalihalobacillus deserti]